jgi:hypothetical protein
MDIPQAYWNLYNQTVTDMIDKHFRTVCKIVYGNNRLECPNCYVNPIIGNSTNEYKAGGPQPFSNSVCPYCNGIGYIVNQSSEEVNVRAYFSKKDFMKLEIPANVNDSTIQIITYLTTMPKLQAAVEIIVNTQLDNYAHYRYTLAGEILPWGLGPDKVFCVSYWNRNQ